MDFTREPIIETVITPKDGCKLVVRSSKSTGQEEYFVDSVEVVCFGNSFFFRSLERPKSFLVPTSDYEVLEVREARMVLKNVGLDKSIKIAGGREGGVKPIKELLSEKLEAPVPEEEVPAAVGASPDARPDAKIDKKRDRRSRHYRRRRGRDEIGVREGVESEENGEAQDGEDPKLELPAPKKGDFSGDCGENCAPISSILTSLLPPPPTLISETIARYKDNVLFKGAFFTKEEQKATSEADERLETEDEEGHADAEKEGVHADAEGQHANEDILGDERELFKIPLEQPEYGSFNMSIEEEEEIYRQRTKLREERMETSSDLPDTLSEDEDIPTENTHS